MEFLGKGMGICRKCKGLFLVRAWFLGFMGEERCVGFCSLGMV